MRRIHLKLAAVCAWIALAVLSVFVFRDTDDFSILEGDPLSEVEPKRAAEVRVCTWNLRNYGVARHFAGGKWREHPKPESERAAIRSILRRIDADIVVLEEMQDRAFLMDLRNSLHSEGLSYKYWAIGKNEAPMRVAILSKLEPEKFVDRSLLIFAYGGDFRASPRGTVGAVYKCGNVEWSVYGFHLKSKYGSKKGDGGFAPFRAAELSAALSEMSHSRPALLCGDFNDEPSEILKTLSGFGFRLVEQSDAEGLAYSYFWAKKNRRFVYDCFYANAKMEPFIRGRARVFGSESLSSSDHRPVYVDLDFSSGADFGASGN